jgi:hypothetical protein
MFASFGKLFRFIIWEIFWWLKDGYTQKFYQARDQRLWYMLPITYMGLTIITLPSDHPHSPWKGCHPAEASTKLHSRVHNFKTLKPVVLSHHHVAPFNNVALDFGTIWHTVSATYYCDWKRQDTKINQDEASIRLHFCTDTRERRTRLKWSRN